MSSLNRLKYSSNELVCSVSSLTPTASVDSLMRSRQKRRRTSLGVFGRRSGTWTIHQDDYPGLLFEKNVFDSPFELLKT